VGPCPTCARSLETNQEVLFCPTCKHSLHDAATFAAGLRLWPDTHARGLDARGLDVQIDRIAEPIGLCPGCERGELRYGRLAGERLARCDGCGALWVGAAALARVRATLTRWEARSRADSPGFNRSHLGAGEALHTLDASRFEYDTPGVNAAALPAALALGVLAQLMGFEIFVFATTSMWAHELGHAVVAWLGGFVAIPLPFVTLHASEDRTFLGAMLLTLSIAIGAFFAFRRRAWALLTLLGGLASLQLLLTLTLNPAQATKWVIFAGLGGELVIPTLWMVAFYQRLPGRWDFWRYPALAASGVTFVRGLFLWTRVVSGARSMPHGSMVGSDSEGDVERLVRFYHFTEHGLAQAYLALAWGCFAMLACVYAFRVRVSLAGR
jgi:hypothetical protein